MKEKSASIAIVLTIQDNLNKEGYNKTLLSLYRQTFEDFEIFLSASLSENLNIYKKDERLKILTFKKNYPDFKRKNSILEKTKSKYVLFLDEGDYLSSNALFKMFQKAEKNYTDIVISKEENSKLSIKEGFYKYDLNTFDISNKRLCGKLYKKEIIEENKIKFIDNSDETFFFMYMPFVFNAYYFDEILYLNNKNIKEESTKSLIKSTQNIVKFLKKKKLFELHKRTFLNYLLNKINKKESKKERNLLALKLSFVVFDIAEYPFLDFVYERNLLKEISSLKENALFWGASKFLEDFLKKYKIKNKFIKGIVDSNKEKIGQKICGFEIFSTEELENLKENLKIKSIISTIKNYNIRNYTKIKKCLQENENCSNIVLHKNIFETKISKNTVKARILRRTTPQKALEQMEVHLADSCNLSCKNCSHFSPLAKENFPKLRTFDKDLKRFNELSKGRLKRLYLLGGEPLLNPNIVDFMKIARKNLPNTRISILTNAILLEKQKPFFWETCRDYNIIINITKYPIKLDFEKIENIAKKFDVELEYYSNTKTTIKTSMHFPLDLEGKQNKKEAFEYCSQANNCIFLKEGKIYACPIAANIVHFNKFFNKNLPIDKKDCIDIYKVNSMEKVLKFISKPIPFCRFCDVKNRTTGHAWGTSKKEIQEWTL